MFLIQDVYFKDIKINSIFIYKGEPYMKTSYKYARRLNCGFIDNCVFLPKWRCDVTSYNDLD